jgi:hypothetical protein
MTPDFTSNQARVLSEYRNDGCRCLAAIGIQCRLRRLLISRSGSRLAPSAAVSLTACRVQGSASRSTGRRGARSRSHEARGRQAGRAVCRLCNRPRRARRLRRLSGPRRSKRGRRRASLLFQTPDRRIALRRPPRADGQPSARMPRAGPGPISHSAASAPRTFEHLDPIAASEPEVWMKADAMTKRKR